MVEDISFPKNLPKVSRTSRVKSISADHEHRSESTADKPDKPDNDTHSKRIDVHA